MPEVIHLWLLPGLEGATGGEAGSPMVSKEALHKETVGMVVSPMVCHVTPSVGK